ncbi:MAG TPA: ACT domain-containing protein [Motilibacteraceae bacterium]|nr:ACT domain-containing protein [Motilibacteraceae bacterium]
MLVRLRLAVPDRPGSLGRVATALGAAAADIVRVDVLDSEAGRALDDVLVEVRDVAHLQRVREQLDAVPGVEVVGAQHPAPPSGGHAELELVDHVVTRPEAAVQTLADGAPPAAGADWAVVLRYGAAGDPEGVVAASVGSLAPEALDVTLPLRLAAVTIPAGAAAVVPLGTSRLALLVVREGGLAFHRSELWRLGQLGEIVGTVLTTS